MSQLLAIACGGALGALLRHSLQLALTGSSQFPLAILIANVSGSFCMGLLFILVQHKALPIPWTPSFFMVGLLGAFTTFSTFSLDTLRLLQSGEWLLAISNILLSVCLALVAAALGMWLGKVCL